MLAIGDFHIPFKSPELASRFRTLLVAGKIQHILCTGNLVSLDIDDYLRSLSPDVHIVRGDMDMVCLMAVIRQFYALSDCDWAMPCG